MNNRLLFLLFVGLSISFTSKADSPLTSTPFSDAYKTEKSVMTSNR